MKTQDFIPFVESLENNDLNFSDPRSLHAAMGIASESGEILGLVKRNVVYHVSLDTNKLKEELGDLLHYAAMLISVNNWTFEDVFEANVQKLRKRYPNGFNCVDAIIRRDKNGGY